MKNIVIIGAGKEGKAYLGEVYDGPGMACNLFG